MWPRLGQKRGIEHGQGPVALGLHPPQSQETVQGFFLLIISSKIGPTMEKTYCLRDQLSKQGLRLTV